MAKVISIGKILLVFALTYAAVRAVSVFGAAFIPAPVREWLPK